MIIGPNGTRMVAYDPRGVGAIIFASVVETNADTVTYTTESPPIEGSKLMAAGLIDNPAVADEAIISRTGETFEGMWQCIGCCVVMNGFRSATAWIRVT